MRKYIEIGLSNTWFIRTETEHDDGDEYEVKGVEIPISLESIYLRIWLGNSIFIFDSADSFKTTTKPKKKFKLVLGLK